MINVQMLFDDLRKRGLLAICEECGNGNETRPVCAKDGYCIRHTYLSPNKAFALVREAIQRAEVELPDNLAEVGRWVDARDYEALFIKYERLIEVAKRAKALIDAEFFVLSLPPSVKKPTGPQV